MEHCICTTSMVNIRPGRDSKPVPHDRPINVINKWIALAIFQLLVTRGYTTIPGVLCLESPTNFIYGRVEAKVFSHVPFMPVLLRPLNIFLGQVIGNASEGKYNTVNNSSSGEVPFQKCLSSGITLFSSKYSN